MGKRLMIASDFKNNILKLKFNDYIARSEDVCFKNICIIMVVSNQIILELSQVLKL